jgi:hypothetical protein
MNFKKLFGLILIGLVLFSCEKEEDGMTDLNETSTATDLNATEVNEKLASVTSIDRKFFDEINKLGEVYAKNEIYNGYDFKNEPAYIIHLRNGRPDKAFVINPTTHLNGAVKLSAADSKGLDIYQYDIKMQDAMNTLNSGNGYYDFDYNINGGKYYLQKYEDWDVNNYHAIDFMTHEVFHMVQFRDWNYRNNHIQDENSYPITRELLELQILVSEIFAKMPNENNKEVLLNKLKQYVAIMTKAKQIDPSSRKLITNMALEQERIEGFAKYIEVVGAREAIADRRNATFLYSSYFSALNYSFNSFNDVKDYFAFSIFYDSGASVSYCIYKALGNEINKIKSETPYGIAFAALNLSDTEMRRALEEAKASVNWSAVQNKARQLMALRGRESSGAKTSTSVKNSREKLIDIEKQSKRFLK